MSLLSKLVTVALVVQATVLVAEAAAAASSSALGPGDLIGGLIDHLTCARTNNRGFKGRCVPRSCCASSLGVAQLCTDPEYTCCYGGDVCSGGVANNGALVGNEFDRLGPFGDRYPPEGNHHHHSDHSCHRQVVTRYEWGAEPNRERERPLHRRVEHIIVHHTEDGERECWSYDECRRYLQHTQRRFQNRKKFPDIPWNFLIGENGEVFEGVGWGVEGYHTESWNDRSVGIGFIGDYDLQAPSRRAMDAFERLLECGVRMGYLDSYYGIYGHRDMRDTECPGDRLYDALRGMRAFQQYGKHGKNILGFIGRSLVNETAGEEDRSAKKAEVVVVEV